MKKLCLLLLLSSCRMGLQAQIPNHDLAAYQHAREGLVVINNAAQRLPLGGLDSLRPALFNFGLADDEELFHTLNTYLPVARLHWEDGEILLEATYPHRLPVNLLILALDGEAAATFPWTSFFDNPVIPVVVVIFGRGSVTDSLPPSAFPTCVFSEDRSLWAQSLAAQLLFGAIGSNQLLGEALNSQLPAGSGQVVLPVQRLAFAPAAALGMNDTLLQDSIAAIMADGLAHQAFPGGQVLVAKDGVVVYHEAFGYHTDNQERPTRLTDIYDLASVTKVTSALPALMKWYGEGAFDLDAPLVAYYPAAQGSNKADLSFRSMLSHQARLRPWIPFWQATLRGNGKYPWSKRRDLERINDYRFRWCTLARQPSTRFPVYLADGLWQNRHYQRQMMKAIRKSPLNEKAEYVYSGLLFYLLPEIVATKAGVDYETYLNQTFYRPLGAYTLGYNPLRYFSLDRIVPTERDSFFRMTLIHGHVHDEGAAMMGGVSGNAGLFANAYDLAKLMQMYLNGGSYGGQQYLAPGVVDTFANRSYAALGNRRGLGFDKPLLEYDAPSSSVAEAASAASFGHSGYTGTFTWADPENGLLFVFLSNRVYPSRNNRGIYIRNIRPRIHTVMYAAMK
jgi:serine-type D-Ala-D-Ala carboxypeptidase